MVRLKLEDMFGDGVNTCKHGAYTVGFALSFLGLEYIDDHFLGGSVTPNLPPDTKLLSKDFAFFASQWLCAWGIVIESLRFGYNALAIPTKFVTGKYFGR